MNNTTMLIMVIGLYLFVILEAIIVFWWYGKNKYIVNFFERKEGVFLKESKRCRVEKIVTYQQKKWFELLKKPVIVKTEYRFFKMFDIFKKNDLGIDYEKVQQYKFLLESMPLIGAKLGLNILIEYDNEGNKIIKSWLPKYELTDDELIINTTVVWIIQAREELMEYTKPDEKKADILMKILLPMGLIILAICMLVFFPKIYNTITSGGQMAVSTAVSGFNSIVDKMIPIG